MAYYEGRRRRDQSVANTSTVELKLYLLQNKMKKPGRVQIVNWLDNGYSAHSRGRGSATGQMRMKQKATNIFSLSVEIRVIVVTTAAC